MKFKMGDYEVCVIAKFRGQEDTESFLERLAEYAKLASVQFKNSGFSGLAVDAYHDATDICCALNKDDVEELVFQYLKDLDSSELVDVWNTFLLHTNREDEVINNMSDFNEIFANNEPYEIALAASSDYFSADDSMFWMDEDGALHSCSHVCDSLIDIIELSDYIYNNFDPCDNKGLMDILMKH